MLDRTPPPLGAPHPKALLPPVVGLLLIVGLQASPARAQLNPQETQEAHPILTRVEPILQRVVSIRGLAPIHPIPAGILDRSALAEVVIQKMDQQISPERFRLEEAILKRLGVLEPECDYRELMLQLLTSQIAGFYDEVSKRLYLIEDLPLALLEPTMAHELFHGIQDQLWGIGRVTERWDSADDAVYAYMALVEGDAVGVMIDYALGPMFRFTDLPNFQQLLTEQMELYNTPELTGLSEEIPSFLIDLMLFPYLSGIGFVQHLESVAGWEGVNQAYLDPPVSTEQVLQPERYLLPDDPTWLELDLTALEAQGFHSGYDQVLGQLGWSALFGQILREEVAQRAVTGGATGWDGDRLIAIENEEGLLVLVSLSVWDTVQDAYQFATLLQRLVEANRAETMTISHSGPTGYRAVLKQGDLWIVLEQWGDMVLYLDGAPEELAGNEAEQWLDPLWSGRTRSGYPATSPDER
ncbi:MAG: hypothetical protein JW797_05240 [Bradymonadales bacterium]|nr:hypothetical protein [Bradymonadales bacterium]